MAEPKAVLTLEQFGGLVQAISKKLQREITISAKVIARRNDITASEALSDFGQSIDQILAEAVTHFADRLAAEKSAQR